MVYSSFLRKLVTLLENFFGKSLKILIQNLEGRGEFLNLDIRQYKHREIKNQQAHRFEYDYVRGDSEGPQQSDGQGLREEEGEDRYDDLPPPPQEVFVCNMCKKDGSVCGRRFARKQSLWLHQDRSGDHDRPKCPKCETVLSS